MQYRALGDSGLIVSRAWRTGVDAPKARRPKVDGGDWGSYLIVLPATERREE